MKFKIYLENILDMKYILKIYFIYIYLAIYK